MELAGQQGDFSRDAAGVFFQQIPGKFQVFPGVGGCAFHPQPFRVDAHGRQFIVHVLGFRHGFVGALAAGEDGGAVRVGGEIVIGGVDPVPQGHGGAVLIDLGSQHHQIFPAFLRVSPGAVDDEALRHGEEGKTDAQAYNPLMSI